MVMAMCTEANFLLVSNISNRLHAPTILVIGDRDKVLNKFRPPKPHFQFFLGI